MRIVEARIDENEFLTLTQEAKRLGVPRSKLIRMKITSSGSTSQAAKLTASQYLDIVSALRKRMGNSIGRAQAEQATAIVLQCLHG